MKINFDYLLNSITHISCGKIYNFIVYDSLILKEVNPHILLSRAKEFRFPLFKDRLTYRKFYANRADQNQMKKHYLALFFRDHDWLLKKGYKEEYFDINEYCFSEKREPCNLFDAIELILDDNFFHYVIENN